MKIASPTVFPRNEQPQHKAAPAQSSPVFAKMLDTQDLRYQPQARAFSETGLTQTCSALEADQTLISRNIALRNEIRDELCLAGPFCLTLKVAPLPASHSSAVSTECATLNAARPARPNDWMPGVAAAPESSLPAPATPSEEAFADELMSAMPADSPAPLEPRAASAVAVKLSDGALHVTFLAGSVKSEHAEQLRRTAAQIIRDEGFSEASVRFFGELTPPLSTSKGSRHG